MKLALGADLIDPWTEHLVLHAFGKLQKILSIGENPKF